MKAEWRELRCEVEIGEGETLVLPEMVASKVGPGRWIVTIQPATSAAEAKALRDHSAFLNSYSLEDEGLYDDAAAG